MAGMNNWPWRVWAERTPFAVALKSRGTAWCWRDLLQRIDSLAAGFIQQGVSEGADVVLRSKNSPDALLAYLALLNRCPLIAAQSAVARFAVRRTAAVAGCPLYSRSQ